MPPAPMTTSMGQVQIILTSLSPLDWMLVAITVWSVLRGLLHGAIRELFAILASLTALATAYWQYRPVAEWLGHWIGSIAERSALAFLLVAFIVFVGVVLVGRVVRALAHVAGLGLLDRLAGAALGVAQAALVGTILITALSAFLPTQAWVERSRLACWFAAPARVLAHAAPVELKQRILTGLTAPKLSGNSLR